MALGWRKEYIRYKSYFLNISRIYKEREDLKIFLEIILSLVAISFFGLFAIRPTFLTIAQLIKDIKNKEETIVKMDLKIGNLQTAQKVLEEEAGKISVLDSSIPTIPQPDIFVRQIEGLALENSVKIMGIAINGIVIKGNQTPNTDQKSNEVSPLPDGANGMGFSLSTTGNYQNLVSFIEKCQLLRIPVKIDIWGINLSKTEGGNILSLIITGRVPYLGQTK
jgi:hypothetical protein